MNLTKEITVTHMLTEAHIDALVDQNAVTRLTAISLELRRHAEQASDPVRALVISQLEKAYLSAGLAVVHKQYQSNMFAELLADSKLYVKKARAIVETFNEALKHA